MKLEFAAAAGQVCQPMSRSPITWPLPRSVLATSTSTVSSGGGGRRRLRRLGRALAARQQRGNAAGGESDTEYDKTRGFHYASLST